MNKKGFGLVIIIAAVAIVALLVGGRFYLNSGNKTQSTIEVGIDAIDKAQDIKDTIEKRNEQAIIEEEI